VTWENAINIKLNLIDISRQIISDRTDILSSFEFVSFLKSSGISFRQCNNLSDLIHFTESGDVKIIITTLKDIPDFLSAKADIKKFTLADLPINFDPQALEPLSYTELLLLLNYLNATNLLQSVTKSNIQFFLQNAKQHHEKFTAEQLAEEIDAILRTEVDYENILRLGALFGELQFRSFHNPELIEQDSLSAIQQRLDQYTYDYILAGNLKNIFYEPSSNVRSVSSILQYLKSNHKGKTALICFDCMGMAEWFLLKEYLRPLNLSYQDRQSFALIPTITSVSRAAIYYGSNTEVFKLTYVNEAKALQQQFPDSSCKLFREKDIITPDSLLGLDVISVIYNFFDDISHATKFPVNFENKSLYFDAARNYLVNSSVLDHIRLILEEGYQLFFCSDHGSIVARGNGKKIDRYLQDKFAKRSCLIDDTTLVEFLDYPQMKIPFVEGKTLVLPQGRSMFDQLNNIEISHGGIAVEELVVPFIEVVK